MSHSCLRRRGTLFESIKKGTMSGEENVMSIEVSGADEPPARPGGDDDSDIARGDHVESEMTHQ